MSYIKGLMFPLAQTNIYYSCVCDCEITQILTSSASFAGSRAPIRESGTRSADVVNPTANRMSGLSVAT